ncbi:hypothetical protein HZB74_00720 [Candidatus Saccharibacteria bacterium]|nr:hypothetical protein [Candidatus Saccharibacteria bacterium]
MVGIGATPANSLLTIGTNTTTAAGGITFGTDTNLYRSANNTLKTDDSLDVGANFDLTGSAAFKRGTDFSTTGSSNNVNFGEVSLVRLTGASAQTITGIANGRDGEILTIVNAASQSATISNNSGSSSAGNQIITGTGANITLAAGGSITLVYDAASPGYWRVAGNVAFSTGNYIQNATTQQTNANFNIKSASAGSVGAVIQGTTAQTADIFQLKDENNLNLLAVGANAGFAIQSSDGFTSTNAFTVGVVNGGVPTTIFGVNSTSPGVYTASTTFSVFNTTATTINAFGAASTINLGAAGATITNPGSLNIRATGTNTLDLDTTGAGTVRLGFTNATTVGIGNTTAATQTTIQGGTGSSAVNIQAGASGTINIGTVSNNNVAINTAAVAGTTVIGGTGTTGQITIGQSTATNTISIGSATPGASSTQTISIGNGSMSNASSSTIVNILSGAAGTNGTASLLMGNNDRVTQIDIGNVAADAARTLNFGTGSNTVGIDTLNIGTGNTTVAGGKTINIGTGTPTGSGSNLVTVGSTALTSNTTIQGGSAGVTVKSGGSTGSTTAFQIQNAAGTATYFSVDNSISGVNNVITIGGNNSPELQAWATTTAIPSSITLGAHATVTHNGYIYIIGGYSGSPTPGFQTTIRYAKIKTDGTLDSWTSASNPLPAALGRHSAIVVNGYLYVIGGTTDNVNALRTVRYAKLNADGSVGSWATTADLGSVAGDRRWDAAVTSANGYIYLIGGSDNTNSQDEIFYARPNADGTISSWSTESDLLPAVRYGIGAVSANGYLYVYGGGNGATSYAATYYARINADPSTGTAAWSTDSDSNLNTSRFFHGAAVSNGYVYAIGGATGTDGATAYASVEYSRLNTDGTLGAWTNAASSLPANRYSFGGGAMYNGYIYAPGGISGAFTNNANYANTVYYTSTQRIKFGGNLDLTSYSNSNGADGNGSGGSLTAGNTNIVGYLQVAGGADIANGLSVGGEFVTTGKATIKSSTNSATAFQVQSASSADTMFSVDTTSVNKVKIGNSTGTGTSTTVFQLDAAASAPFGTGQTAYLGSMYYDSTQGKLQCYENRNGTAAWGACGSAPNNIITLTPEYTGAVLNGTGVGTLTADFCSNQASVLVVGTLCASGEARNFYKWTSPQGTDQTYGIYVTYKLPSTFSGFNDANTIKLTALTDSTTNANATLQVFRKNVGGGTIVSCGSATTINNTANTWQQTSFGGDETACGFVGGDYVIFKINVTAKSSGNVYVENLDFTYTNQ